MIEIENILDAADGCDVIADVDGVQHTFHFSPRPADIQAAVQAILDAAPVAPEYEIEGE